MLRKKSCRPNAKKIDVVSIWIVRVKRDGRAHLELVDAQLVVTERAVAKHTPNILGKLGMPVSDDDNRRVLAVLAYLDRG